MSSSRISEELRQALTRLAQEKNPDPSLIERIARWRRACGDAEAAAQWQIWSLLPPTSEELRPALASLLSGLGESHLAMQLLPNSDQRRSWERLAVLIERKQLKQAASLQRKLLTDPPDLAENDLINLLNQWLEAELYQEALSLLYPLLTSMQKRGETLSSRLCCTMADLLEKQQRFNEAESWWMQAHILQPQQVWPVMRLGYQALRQQKPTLAFHYARQTLKRSPHHAHAPELQRKALQAMSAERSLALLDGNEPPSLPPSQTCSPPPAECIDSCLKLALVALEDVSILQDWADQLDATTASQTRLYLISSHDPLWLEQQAHQLLPSTRIDLWPSWDGQRHGDVDLVLTACPADTIANTDARIWRYDAGTNSWNAP
jgi:tetratricopeptide (TPR) repeat protein